MRLTSNHIHPRLHHQSGRASRTILILVSIVLVLALATTYFLSRIPSIPLDPVAQAFHTNVNSKVVLSGVIKNMKGKGKLVVLQADVLAVAESETQKSIFFDMVDLGTTRVRVRAPAKVQYVLPLTDLDQHSFFFDPTTNRLMVKVPNPILDEDMVEITTDPAKIEVEKKIGWGRLDAHSGKYNERRARVMLRDAAILAGKNGPWLLKAQENTKQTLRPFLQELIDALREGVKLDVAFTDTVSVSMVE